MIAQRRLEPTRELFTQLAETFPGAFERSLVADAHIGGVARVIPVGDDKIEPPCACKEVVEQTVARAVFPQPEKMVKSPPGDAGTCIGVDTACTFSSECCSFICSNGACGAPRVCQGQGGSCTSSADCCAGNNCSVPTGSTFGSCQPSTCAGLGQTCALGSTSCCGGVSCIDTTTFALCGTTGSCICATN